MLSAFEEAEKLLRGERQEQYGPPMEAWVKIAKLWTIYYNSGKPTHELPVVFLAADVAIMNVLEKIMREGRKHKRDNLLDAIAYLAAVADDLYQGT